MFKELFTESKKVTITIDWASEMKDADKKYSKMYNIKIKDTGRMEAKVTGTPEEIMFFLTGIDYGMPEDDVKEYYPEVYDALFEAKTPFSWEGGSDSYEDARKIEKLLAGFDFYTMYIDDRGDRQRKQKQNDLIKKELTKLGVTSIWLKEDPKSKHNI